MARKKTKPQSRRRKQREPKAFPPGNRALAPNVGEIASAQDRAAYVRVQQAKKLNAESSRRDLQGAARFEKALQLEIGLRFAAAVPFKFLGQWTGRQNTLLYAAADRYGVPIRGPSWNVASVVKWLFEFLAKHGSGIRLQEASDGDGFVAAREELYKERIHLVRLERRTREGALIPVDLVVESLQLAGQQLRTAALQLQREFGPRAWEIYNDALTAANDVIETLCNERPLNDQAVPRDEVAHESGDDAKTG